MHLPYLTQQLDRNDDKIIAKFQPVIETQIHYIITKKYGSYTNYVQHLVSK